MKMFLISDNLDTETGMRLAGVKGVIVHERQDLIEVLNASLKDKEIGIIMITEKLAKLIPERLNDIKLNTSLPLIVEIPDRHGTGRSKESITSYIKEAIGVKVGH